MISELHIKNYKSIKDLSITPKRINLLIGEHNSGKSNILEALSWFSVNALDKEYFSRIFRFKNIGDFFYNFDGTQMIEVSTDSLNLKIRYAKNSTGAILNFFEGIIFDKDSTDFDESNWLNIKSGIYFNLNIQLNSIENRKGFLETDFRSYQFRRLNKFSNNYLLFLSPPFGENIPNIITANKDLKQLVSDFFLSKNYRLIMKPTENEVEMAKDVNGDLYSFPYRLISETMQRYIFGKLAIKSNQKAVLILDEPEINMFPFFVKDLSESIADDISNQYFITTHNPFMLSSLLEKTDKDELAVFITTMHDYETKVQQCSHDQIEELLSLGSGALFNLDNITAV